MPLDASSIALDAKLDTLGWRFLDTTATTVTVHQSMSFNFLGLGGGGVFRIKGLSWVRCFLADFC